MLNRHSNKQKDDAMVLLFVAVADPETQQREQKYQMKAAVFFTHPCPELYFSSRGRHGLPPELVVFFLTKIKENM